MDDVLDMSLDDYINSFSEAKDHKSTNKNIIRSEESKFKEGRRQQIDDEELEDELTLDCQEDDYVSLAPKRGEMDMDENVKNDSSDLRNKILGRFPKSSQQWRLMQPNIMNVRPAGMPPLIPSDAPQNSLNGNCNGNRNNWRNYNNRNRRNYKNNNWQHNNNNNNRNNNNNFNAGRIQRFNNSNNRPNLNSKNIKIVLDQLKQRNPMILYSMNGTPDLTIESTTTNASNSFGSPNFSLPQINMPDIKPQPIAIASADSTQSVQSPQSKGSDAIKSLLGVGDIALRNDMMPALAGRLLDILNGTTSTIHKPMYDMKIQKEIHEIQKKPLLYKCPGGEVVSSDGAGVPDCKIQPKVSGISLNNRFA